MRYLNKIIFLNSAHIPYAEVRLDGNVHFIGTQGVGKSTLLRAILFFYNADKLRLGIPKEKKPFDAFYFPHPNSYIVYEVKREGGAYCVLALKSQGRVAFRFINAPYSSKWFIDEHNQVYGDLVKVRKQVGKSDISSVVSSYEMYRDIIFGNNHRPELLPYRKYAIVESAKYQNIPRTIQNVFLNTKLDADFIKNTIIQSMSDENVFIDLTFFREQIKEFEQEYRDVSLWSKKERNGEVLVLRMATGVMDSFRSLLDGRRQIKQGRQELNYAERLAQEMLPQCQSDIQAQEAECNRLARLKDEEQDKYGKERDKLKGEISVLDSHLKTIASKRKHYEEIHIEDIMCRMEQEPVVEEELKRQEAMKAELEKSCQSVVDKYKALIDQLDLAWRAYENSKNMQVNAHREDCLKKQGNWMQELRKSENDARFVAKEKMDGQTTVITQLTNEETSLRVQKAKVSQENPFAKDMEACQLEQTELMTRKAQLEAEVKEQELRAESLRQEAESVQSIMELQYEQSLAEPNRQKDEVEAEITKLTALLNRSKGSLAEWLDQNKAGWQENIGRVVDEEAILYNNELAPRLSAQPEASLYGVCIDLTAMERKFRTPDELKGELDEKNATRTACVKRLNDMHRQHEEDSKALMAKYQGQVKRLVDSTRVLRAELMTIPQQEKRLKMQTVELDNRLADWRKEELAKLEDKQNEVVARRTKTEESRRKLEDELQRKLNALQADYRRRVRDEKEALQTVINAREREAAERKQQTELRKEELMQARQDEQHGQGMDTVTLDRYSKRILELQQELGFIKKHRDEVAVYKHDREQWLDRESSVRQERKSKAETLAMLEDKYRQRSERLAQQIGLAQEKLGKLQARRKELQNGLDTVKAFRSDDNFCPVGSNELEEKATSKSCLAIVDELKGQIFGDDRLLSNFKRQTQQFLGQFSSRNTFHFNVSPVTDEEFFDFASNLCEFVENDKISEYQRRISGRYTDIILRISKEVSDLTRRESDIRKTIIDINHDFEERNFAGVIREIALRPRPTSDPLMLLLMRIRDFSDEHQYDMGEMDLFATESRQEVNARAVKYLLDFMKALLDEPNRKQLQVSDTFRLEFRIKENDNDTGWVEKIANVGSDGTDILVKAMVNIMLINVFKEKASCKSGEFKIHCMMDEIGKLHPNNVKGILDFANRRNILLVNSSPTTYNVEDYRYTYLLSKDSKARTKVVQLIKKL